MKAWHNVGIHVCYLVGGAIWSVDKQTSIFVSIKT